MADGRKVAAVEEDWVQKTAARWQTEEVRTNNSRHKLSACVESVKLDLYIN